jgi:hypothetical protein
MNVVFGGRAVEEMLQRLAWLALVRFDPPQVRDDWLQRFAQL